MEVWGGFCGFGSVWGSGMVGILCVIVVFLGWIFVSLEFWWIGFVASFCSKFSDIIVSEIGKVYGKMIYMSMLLFKLVFRGMEGVVSVEGIVVGIVVLGLFVGFAFIIG